MAGFQKGERVQLSSGGPVMSVADVGDYSPLGAKDGVKCTWFDGKKVMEHVFDAATLRRAGSGLAASPRA